MANWHLKKQITYPWYFWDEPFDFCFAIIRPLIEALRQLFNNCASLLIILIVHIRHSWIFEAFLHPVKRKQFIMNIVLFLKKDLTLQCLLDRNRPERALPMPKWGKLKRKRIASCFFRVWKDCESLVMS